VIDDEVVPPGRFEMLPVAGEERVVDRAAFSGAPPGGGRDAVSVVIEEIAPGAGSLMQEALKFC